MIAKAPQNGKRGSDTYGLLRYLFGPGRANEHINPHLVAASDPEWLAGGAFAGVIGQRGWLARLTREIDTAMIGHDVHLDDGHVYHVVLAVPRADGPLGEGTWRSLVEDAIEHMGFGPDSEGAGGCRWIAVHHGLSVEGNDHVHIVVNLVRGDGRIANTFRDWPRWRSWCLAVEERLDLTRTAPAGVGRKAISRAELDRAAKSGVPPERHRLTQIVAGAASAADGEIDFLARLRRARLRYKPHLAGGEVTGYTVAAEADGQNTEPLWFAGSTLRRDLSLPRLRARWEDPGPLWAAVAVQFWTGDRVANRRESTPVNFAWREVTQHLTEASVAVGEDIADDRDKWSHTVGETADLVAALARFDPDHGRLLRVADQLACAAQLERGQRRPRPREPGVAFPLLVAATRAAAICKDPAPLVLAGVLLLVWSIVKVLQNAAERQRLRVHASARQQIDAAAEELAGHPVLRTEGSRWQVPPPSGHQASRRLVQLADRQMPPRTASTPVPRGRTR